MGAALGFEWIQRSYSVLFISTFKLVDRLLRAKQDYELESELRRLDRFQVVIVDDLGYVQQSREEMEVLFTFSLSYHGSLLFLSGHSSRFYRYLPYGTTVA